MKTRLSIFLLLIFSIALISCSAQNITKKQRILLDEFSTSFSSENFKLRGKLILFGDYKNDLSSMTYEEYLNELKKNLSPSTKINLVEIIRNSDKHIFGTKKKSFIVGIYSKELNVVLYDDAYTSFIDSIVLLKKNQLPPKLFNLISKKGYEIKNE